MSKLFSGNFKLVKQLCSQNNVSAAQKAFQQNPDLGGASVLINFIPQNTQNTENTKNSLELAFSVIETLRTHHIPPDQAILRSIVKICCFDNQPSRALSFLLDQINLNFSNNYNLIDRVMFGMITGSCVKTGDSLLALSLLNLVKSNYLNFQLNNKDCTQLIQALKRENTQGVLDVYMYMQKHNIPMDSMVYSSVLASLKDEADLPVGDMIYKHMTNAHVILDNYTTTSLIHMYTRCGQPQRALTVWSKFVGQNGSLPNQQAYIAVLLSCAELGSTTQGEILHNKIKTIPGLNAQMGVQNALIHMYGKGAELLKARQIFDSIRAKTIPDITVWTTLISADRYGQNGKTQDAANLFSEMKNSGILPDSTAYSTLLNAYSHTGMIDQATNLFTSIPTDKRDMVVCNNMVDVLARAGNFDSVKTFIKENIQSPNLITWMTFLGACRTYGNVEMAKFAAEKALELNPKHPPVYVMLSNIYAAQGQWDKQAEVRKLMGQRNIKKIPGMSWIEISGKTHSFLVNDAGHPQMGQIMAQIERMKTDAKNAGFVADTCFILHDVEEEQKLDLLWYHSEKLALAYGLIAQDSSSTIRISKNLRVCGDCHSALLLFSKLYKREIIVRDRSRQHYFKDGKCSCKQYW